MEHPRIVLWDIETTHNLAAVFRLLGNDYIQADNLLQERYIVSAAWKVLGEKVTHSVSVLDDPKRFARDPHDDRFVCETLHEVLSGADVIVAHNGDAYDIKFTEGRFIFHALDPLPPITKIDTLKTARDRFLFNANNLDYLGRFLGVGRKIKTDNTLWLKVLEGNKSAIRQMEEYNRGDIILLEKVFLRLRPYMASHINRELWGGKGCPRCGSTSIQSRGVHRSLTRIYQRFQCKGCGGWFKQARSSAGAKHRVL